MAASRVSFNGIKNRFTKLFDPPLKTPIIGAGMVWCSGYKLAIGVSEAGGLGLLGSGSMCPDVLLYHIKRCQEKLDSKKYTYGVNLPVANKYASSHIQTIIDNKVPVVVTSAGNPNTFTRTLQKNGIIVGHVVGSAKFALKALNSGVDFIVVEGFEAGGHNSREETTTMCLIRDVTTAIKSEEKMLKEDEPIIIAAGGISCGKTMLSCMILGADGVQIGSRFVVSKESSAHSNFKDRVVDAKEGETFLSIKKIVPVRLLANEWARGIQEADYHGASKEILSRMLGTGRSKKGMFEGDLIEGELEIGQVCSQINTKDEPVGEIIDRINDEFIIGVNDISNHRMGLV